MYRIDDNPPMRYPEGRPLQEDRGQWAVARLKSRREKAFAQELSDRGVGYFLPLYVQRIRRQDTGKARKSVRPLFPGYVAFVQTQDSRRHVFGSGHVANVIEVKDQDGFVDELRSVQRILGEPVDVEPHPDLLAGDRVRIVFGPLAGMQGRLVERGSAPKIAVGVKAFGGSVSVRVSASWLAKI